MLFDMQEVVFSTTGKLGKLTGNGDSPAVLPEVRQQYGLGAPRLSLMRKRTLHHSEVWLTLRALTSLHHLTSTFHPENPVEPRPESSLAMVANKCYPNTKHKARHKHQNGNGAWKCHVNLCGFEVARQGTANGPIGSKWFNWTPRSM